MFQGEKKEIDEVEEKVNNYKSKLFEQARKSEIQCQNKGHRQRDSKPDEFEAYNEYAEYCKVEVKRRMIEDIARGVIPEWMHGGGVSCSVLGWYLALAMPQSTGLDAITVPRL